MDEAAEPQARSPDPSVRVAGEALLGLVATRIELLGVELHEEALHLQRMLVQGVVAAFLFGAAVVMAGVLVAAAFWDSHRLLALAGVTVFYGGAGAVLIMRLRSFIETRPAPFHATVGEIEADLKALRQGAGKANP